MLVLDSGNSMSRKNRMGLAPSMRAASASSSGTVRKNCRKRNVAVAEAMSGRVSPTYEFSRCRSDATRKERHRHREDLLERQCGCDERDVQRKSDYRHAKYQHGVRQQRQARPVLD